MYRLIYKSSSAVEVNWDMVRDILRKSTEHNVEAGITGVLLATEHHFMQVIEGSYEKVNETFMRIVKDQRHKDILIVSFGVIDARIFHGWGMKGIGVFDINRDIEADLMRKYGEEDGGLRFPLEEWMTLALIQDVQLIGGLPTWKAGQQGETDY